MVHKRTLEESYNFWDWAWLYNKAAGNAVWSRTDWRSSLEDIIFEHDMFHNDIPFSGDTRSFLLHNPQPPTPPKGATR